MYTHKDHWSGKITFTILYIEDNRLTTILSSNINRMVVDQKSVENVTNL